MTTMNSSTFAIYRTAIEQVMHGEERLPSLPNMTLQIRRAAADENTTVARLCGLIGTDPSLSVVVMRHSSSPLFKTLQEASDLEGAIRLMGIPYVANLVMAHSLKSLFINNNPKLRELFAISWKRQALKASMCRFIATDLGFKTPDEAFISSLLSEVGTLSIISAVSNLKEIPDQRTYLTLCRHYSKPLATIILRRWDMDEKYLTVAKGCGDWKPLSQYTPGPITALDVVNLALYHTVCLLKKDNDLPPLTKLELYKRLPAKSSTLDQRGLLLNVTQNLKEIVAAAQAFH